MSLFTTPGTLMWAAFLGAILGSVYLLYRLQAGLERAARDRADNAFRQAEALQALYVELKFDKPLPRTRGGAGSPDFLLELARAARRRRPRVIVECGSGVSTLVLARAVHLNGDGHVWSLEDDARHAGEMRQELEDHGLAQWATIVEAPLEERRIRGETFTWYADIPLPVEGIDMVVVDGPVRRVGRLARYPAGPVLFPQLTDRGVIFLDDALRRSEQRVLKRWAREFPDIRQELGDCEKGLAVLMRDPATAG